MHPTAIAKRMTAAHEALAASMARIEAKLDAVLADQAGAEDASAAPADQAGAEDASAAPADQDPNTTLPPPRLMAAAMTRKGR